MGKFNYEVGMCIEECISCGISFGVPISFINERKKNHKSFCCPNGHHQYYPDETKEEKLERELNRTEKRLNYCQLQSKNLDYRARYYKGQLTKIKKQLEV